MKRTVGAIVLTTENRRESDRLIRILCEDGQLLRVYAAGARNPRNKLCAATEPFVLSKMELFAASGGYTLDDAEITEQFFELRMSLKSYCLAGYIAQLILTVFSGEVDPSLYALFGNMLFLLAGKKRDIRLLKAVMEFRIAALAGWRPEIEHCACCASTEIKAFSVADGGGYCEKCASAHAGAVSVSSPILKAVCASIGDDTKGLFSFTLTGEAAEGFSRLAEYYIRYYIDAKLPALDYYNSLLEFEESINGIQHTKTESNS